MQAIILLVLFFGLGFVSARQDMAATRNAANFYHIHRGRVPITEIRGTNDPTEQSGRRALTMSICCFMEGRIFVLDTKGPVVLDCRNKLDGAES